MSANLLNEIHGDSFSYCTGKNSYDEMFDQQGGVRTSYELIYQRFSKMGLKELEDRNSFLKSQMIKQGITFTLNCGPENDSESEKNHSF